jgi:hypothetical protein
MPCKRVSLSIGTPLGKLEGIVFIWVPFLDPGDIKILSLGAIWTSVKVQGFPELISDYGAQRTRL